MKILVHADDRSIKLGLRLAGAFSSTVTILESSTVAGMGAAALSQFQKGGIVSDLIVRPSDWLQALRVATRAQKYDLALVGAMWRRGVLGKMIGSLPRQLLSDVRTSLLIVRRDRGSLSRVLVATGSGPRREEVFRWAGQIAKRLDAQPTLLHVTERAPLMFSGLANMEETLVSFLRSNDVEALAFKDSIQVLRGFGVEPKLKLRRGYVVEEILSEARSGAYDLIVLGSSYTGSAPSRLLLEGIPDHLVPRAPCPVLIVRAE